MTTRSTDRASVSLPARARRSLARSRRLTALSMRIERLWPLLAPLAWVLAGFLALAWFGVFRAVPDWARFALLVAFVPLAWFSTRGLARYRDPSAAEIDRRVERANGLEHAPVSAQADALPDDATPAARALWAEHRRRIAERLSRLEGAAPRAGMPARDPWALRALVPLVALVAFAYSFGSAGGQLADAFAPPAEAESVAARVDAWVTPPDYTGLPPVFLTRASDAALDPGLAIEPAGTTAPETRTVPEGSVVTLRVAGAGTEVIVETLDADGATRVVPPAEIEGAPVPGNAVHEVTLEADATVRLAADGATLAFPFAVTPDEVPRIAWVENEEGAVHEVSDTGALSLAYSAEDDYPLAGAEAVMTPVGLEPRALYDVPDMPLVLPRERASTSVARTRRDLTEHPFAGAVVDAQLVATDRAGQIGVSDERRFTLPERTFRQPLALALLEQRRALALDADSVPDVLGNLDLILLHAETTVDDTVQYLGLVTARARVANAWDDEMLRGAADYLWELARGIEDGALNSAERRLRDAQDAVSEALEEGATDEELAALMEELREAMAEFMDMMAQRMAELPPEMLQNVPPGMQMMTEQDLNRMLDTMEDAARNGQRDQAQAMLDELRRMMDQMQAGTPQQGQQQQQAGEMQQQMQEMGDLLREQQELMDETFRMEGSRPPPDLGDPTNPLDPNAPRQSPQQSQPPQAGQPPQPGQPPQSGEQGEQQAGQQPQPGEPMTPEEFADAMEALRERQEALQERLDEMQETMEGMGLEPGEQFGEAGEAMGEAGEDLGEGQSGPAVDDQGRAIQALREGAQNMMQQMMQAMQGQQGQGMGGMMPMMPGQGQQPGQQGQGQGQQRLGQGFGGTREDRDPLGRPRATTGPQFGDEIEVPDEIDAQRAREILESIRRRLGERLTPRMEREYLERLLEMR